MILVTGATGRIGKHLVAALLEKGEDVRVFVRNAKKAEELWGKNVDIVEGNILDKIELEKAMEGVDVVYHLAALVSYTASRDKLFKINVEGTRNVLEAGEGKRIIFLSSAAVYGKRAPVPITELTPFSPTDVYGESKALADKMAREAGAIVLRPTIVYGPGFSEGLFKLFELLVKKRMVIAGSGKNRLQWTHINDLISALLLAKEKGKRGEAYNIVSGDVKTQEEFLAIVCKNLGVAVPRRHVPVAIIKLLSLFFARRAYIDTFVSDRVFDCSKAKSELGWQPKMKFEEGLKEVVNEYLLTQGAQR